MIRFSLALLFVSLFAFQSIGQDITTKQLLVEAADLLNQGWTPTHSIDYSKLDDDESVTLTFTLDGDWEYRIIAFCDEDCKDLDMTLFDENDNEIDKDNDEGDYAPVIRVSPSWTGEFSLTVTMFDCEVEPCKMVVGIFGKED